MQKLPARTSSLQASLGSTFVKCAFLQVFSEDIARNIDCVIDTSRWQGAPGYRHSINAARPLAAALSKVHLVVEHFTVSDEASLTALLSAAYSAAGMDEEKPQDGLSEADHKDARVRLGFVLSLAVRRARQALAEVESGFEIGGGDLSAWLKEVTYRDECEDGAPT